MTSVKLMSWTRFPLETLWCVWEAGKSRDPLYSPDKITLDADKLATVKTIIDGQMPITENIDFVFALSDVPVALREHIVRHRIGTKVGQNYGVDIIPELGDSSWWIQSTRILDMSKFASNGEYHTPTWLEKHGDEPMPSGQMTKAEFYHSQMKWIQGAYKRMMDAGFPIDDARNILPLATTHRITWHLNLKALLYITQRRGCWLLQLGLWEPVIRGMVEELVNRVHPIFRRIIDPPCFEQGEWAGCPFEEQNNIRLSGDDPNIPCPLFCNMHEDKAEKVMDENATPWSFEDNNDGTVRPHHMKDARVNVRYGELFEQYRSLWHRDPHTGERVQLTHDGEPL